LIPADTSLFKKNTVVAYRGEVPVVKNSELIRLGVKVQDSGVSKKSKGSPAKKTQPKKAPASTGKETAAQKSWKSFNEIMNTYKSKHQDVSISAADRTAIWNEIKGQAASGKMKLTKKDISAYIATYMSGN
jgi:hypothetical protein